MTDNVARTIADLAIGACVGMMACMLISSAYPQELQEPPDCSGDRCVHFGVRVSPSDIAIKTMYGLCMLHTPVVKDGKVIDNADWWPSPCNEVQAKFRDSGAQAKWEEIEKRDKANQLDMVKRGLGK